MNLNSAILHFGLNRPCPDTGSGLSPPWEGGEKKKKKKMKTDISYKR